MMTRFVLLTALVLMVSPATPRPEAARVPGSSQLALYCTLTGQQAQGANKVCFYNCKGDGYSVTIPGDRYCPLGVEPNSRH
jgi:hypothetical protein